MINQKLLRSIKLLELPCIAGNLTSLKKFDIVKFELKCNPGVRGSVKGQCILV